MNTKIIQQKQNCYFQSCLPISATATSIMQVASLIENIGAAKINTYHKEFKKIERECAV